MDQHKIRGQSSTYQFTIDLKNCTGCRLCEVACSYALSGKFNPELSNLRIDRYNGEITFSLSSACRCTEPLCLKYCVAHAILDVKMNG